MLVNVNEDDISIFQNCDSGIFVARMEKQERSQVCRADFDEFGSGSNFESVSTKLKMIQRSCFVFSSSAKQRISDGPL